MLFYLRKTRISLFVQGDEYVINTALKDDREARLSVSRLTAQVRIRVLLKNIVSLSGLASLLENSGSASDRGVHVFGTEFHFQGTHSNHFLWHTARNHDPFAQPRQFSFFSLESDSIFTNFTSAVNISPWRKIKLRGGIELVKIRPF